MKQITVWKTTDGGLWEDQQEAATHQSTQDLKGMLTTLNELCSYGGFDLADIPTILQDHRNEILNFYEQKQGETKCHERSYRKVKDDSPPKEATSE